jgi:hypothetical protein
MNYAARRVQLLENREINGFLIFDLDRTMPSRMDRPNLQYLSDSGGALLIALKC